MSERVEIAATRQELAGVAEQWITLWTVPVDWDLFDRLHAEDFEDLSSAGRPTSKGGFAQGLRDLTRAFPDLKTAIEDVVIDTEAQMVAVRWSATGTNQQKYLGIGPTDRLTRFTGIEIIEVHSQQIVKRWGEWDVSDHSNSTD